MTRSRLLLAVASVLAGTAVLMVTLGAVYNPLLVALAAPFGIAAYFMWLDATGRLDERLRRRHERRGMRGTPNGGRTGGGGLGGGRTARNRGMATEPADGPTRTEARRILGVAADADAEAIRRAYREQVKDVHPDAEDGSEEAFKRVTAAYDRLRE